MDCFDRFFCNPPSGSGVGRSRSATVDRFTEIRAKREGARRARRLAWSVTDEVIRERMLVFAEELEAEADALAWNRGSDELKTASVQ